MISTLQTPLLIQWRSHVEAVLVLLVHQRLYPLRDESKSTWVSKKKSLFDSYKQSKPAAANGQQLELF